MVGGTARTPGLIYHEQFRKNNIHGDRSAYFWWKNRGFRLSTLAAFRIGYVDQPLPGDEQYEGMFSIPYLDAQRREVKLRFRDPHPGKRSSRYLDRKGADPHLFGVKFTSQPGRTVWLTEGELDCMILHQMGFKAVGVAGADAWQEEWAWLFRDCAELVLCADGDGQPPGIDQRGYDIPPTKGYAFIQSIQESMKSFECNVRVAMMPQGMDVNDLYLMDRAYLRKLVT